MDIILSLITALAAVLLAYFWDKKGIDYLDERLTQNAIKPQKNGRHIVLRPGKNIGFKSYDKL